MATFGEQIKQAREKKNLSQEELAELMQVSRQSISKWENDLAVPQGENRRRLAEVLELKPEDQGKDGEGNAEGAIPADNFRGNAKAGIGGWLVAAFLLIALAVSWVFQHQDKETEQGMPAWKEILFYDDRQTEVTAEDISYNAAKIDSILVQWKGDGAKSIDMYYEPIVAEPGASQEKELLLTQKIPDGHSAVLLNGESLGRYLQGQVYFELKIGNTVLVSEKFSMVYDPTIMAYIREFEGKNLVVDEVEWVQIPSERATELGLADWDAGFEIYNESDALTELPLSDDCVCTVLDWTGDYQEMQVAPEELADILREREGLAIPYTLLIREDRVVSISEHYLP